MSGQNRRYQHVVHTFGPLYNEDSGILILGSIPSPASREVEEKKALVLSHGLALWDVIEECDIIGASDSSVKNAVPTDIPSLLGKTQIQTILCNGALSKKIYDQYQLPRTGIPAQKMPSTSPANAAWSLERLKEEWRRALLR